MATRFIHISDTHISHLPGYSEKEAAHTPDVTARALVETINALPFTPDFVLHTGDVCYDPVAAAYPLARDILSGLRVPIYYLAGNHDSADEVQRVLVGQTPVTPFDYTFEVNGVQIVCIDSNGVPDQPPHGRVRDESLAWLRQVASPDDPRPLVVATHHNPLTSSIPWWDDYMRMLNGDALHAALVPLRERLRGVFYGHVHQPTDTLRDGILYVSVASAWYQIAGFPGQTRTLADPASPTGFNIVTITEGQTFVRRCAFHV